MQQVLTTNKTGAGFIKSSMLLGSAEAESRVINYKSLLCRIAKGFGFSESEAGKLFEEVLEYARNNRVADCVPFRVWASRIIVHKCAYRIGKKVFWQSGSGSKQNSLGINNSDGCDTSSRPLHLKDMPLSFRAVFILRQLIGFSVLEIAQMLNTTPAQVIERYNKALAFLDKE